MDVAVSGSYAYVACAKYFPDGGGLAVIDISTPSAPAEVGFIDTPSFAYGVAVSGGYAYVAGGGLHVIDVSTPSAPVEVGFLEGEGRAVTVEGGYAYVTGGSLHDDVYARPGGWLRRKVGLSRSRAATRTAEGPM
jgi:hypothetical protein